MGWLRRRREQPALSGAGASSGSAGPSGHRFEGFGGGQRSSSPMGLARGAFGGLGSSSASARPIQLDKEDFDAFERMLGDVQEAWSRRDHAGLRALATPEMGDMFAEDLEQDARKGVVNRVSGVKLLQGDLAESWREGDRDYATVAMRYELVDVTEDAATARVVEGDAARPVEATELWTFARDGRDGWRLSAIQQTA
jgi:predicted lipid-binding transport protein (Tim44 family)